MAKRHSKDSVSTQISVQIPGKFVRVSNEFTRTRIRISKLISLRIFSAFASLVKEDDEELKEYTIPASTVIKNFGGGDYRTLKDSVKTLISESAVELSNDSNQSFRFYSMFSYIDYHDGNLTCSFNPKIKRLLLQLKEFTKMELVELLNLPSIYSYILFQYLMSWRNIPCGYVVVSLEDMHRILDVPESCAKDFRDFRRRVLEKAHKDIHEKTKLRYQYEAIKTGRKITSIKFIFLSQEDIHTDICDVRCEKISESNDRLDASDMEKNNIEIAVVARGCYEQHGCPAARRCHGYMKDNTAKVCIYCATQFKATQKI